ncbi:MAG: DMP19 family protein [Bacteroidales bacterium]|nr:DMP19 family protein [Bacteroidales bacterium]
METKKIQVTDAALRRGAEAGMDEFLQVVVDACLAATGGGVDAATMPLLNGWQHSLLGYHFFREEVDEGGFIQLIQNGYGPYIFLNPFAKAMRLMGAKDFSKLLYEAREIYDAHREDLERDCTEDEFMAMYERYEAFDDLEERFMDMEEEVTETLARYVDEHLEDFVEVIPGGE